MNILLPALVEKNIGQFCGRAWLLPILQEWFDVDKRTFLLMGDPGTGKSMIMAWLAGFGPEPDDTAVQAQLAHLRQHVAAVHFCQANDSNSWTKRAFADRIANQLRQKIKGYDEALVKALAPYGIKIEIKQIIDHVEAGATVIGLIIKQLNLAGITSVDPLNISVTEPLVKLYENGYDQPMLILVDSLDEAWSGKELGQELVEALSKLDGLPAQVKLLVTTREDQRVLKYFEKAPQFDLVEGWKKNPPVDLIGYPRSHDLTVNDIYNFSISWLRKHLNLDSAQTDNVANHVALAADGIFLYAYMVLLNTIPTMPIEELERDFKLPDGLGGLYHDFLIREFDPESERWFDKLRPLLGLIAVAQGEGLTRQQLQAMLGYDPTQNLRICHQYLSGKLNNGPFRLFHKSLADYLLEDEENVDYEINAAEMHGRVVAFYKGQAATWEDVNWVMVDDYGLRYLTTHLNALNHEPLFRKELYGLVNETNYLNGAGSFHGEYLRRWRDPNPLFSDIRLALNLALADNELVQSWQQITLFQRLLLAEKGPAHLLAAVQEGDFDAALERTQLYTSRTILQAWSRLWIAWVAASAGNQKKAAQAVRLALWDLPALAILGEAPALKEYEASEVRDQLTRTTKRLLTRIAIEVAKIPPRPGDPPTNPFVWLQNLCNERDEGDGEQLLDEWTYSLVRWKNELTMPEESFCCLVSQFEKKIVSLEPDGFRELTISLREKLCAAAAYEADEPDWLANVSRAAKLIAADDYPSYREMSLAWLAIGVLTNPSVEETQNALGELLRAGLEAREPELAEDAPAMILAFTDPIFKTIGHSGQWGDELEKQLVELAHIRQAQQTIYDIHSSGRTDPWAWAVRRGSAIVAALYRGKFYKRLEDVYAIMDFRTTQDHTQSFAGYRCLAYLSAAFRWLELDKVEEDPELRRERARQKAQEAAVGAAEWIVDPVVKQQRLELIALAQSWIDEAWPSADDAEAVSGALRQVDQFAGLTRSYYLQFLAGIWCMEPTCLKRLLPYTLGDPIAADAVFGRLLGNIAQTAGFKPTFDELWAVMQPQPAAEAVVE